ncbi:hypothetical protein H8K33_12375 [Undibacterium amnicola]|uniref:Nuclear transport factor 2 family protein n=1 Tax=Undibacterium amnicola TaxID=1834038 RepID=A0ABR6XSA6_9BURK|nr:hypothetical protein [Undibacterium amnicola]MBC3832311.1 hypothetical protein [Undibacterium amnicola]
MKISLLILTLLCSFIVSGFVGAQEKDRKVSIEARKFLAHLLSKNEAKLIEYEDEQNIFSSEGKINGDIYDFLYTSKTNSKSVVEIAEMDKVLIKVIKQKGNVVTILFYPKKFQWEINNDLTFLEKEWMKKYFACEFVIHRSKLKFHYSFCFAETGGPFHSEQ